MEAPTAAIVDAQVPVGPRTVGQAVALDARPTCPSPPIAVPSVRVLSAPTSVPGATRVPRTAGAAKAFHCKC